MDRRKGLTPVRKNLNFNQYQNIYIDDKLVTSFQQVKLSIPESKNIRFRYIKNPSNIKNDNGMNDIIRIQIEQLQ
jgi:hypothetical protein